MIYIIMLSVPDGLICMYITLSYLKRDQTPGRSRYSKSGGDWGNYTWTVSTCR